MLCVVTMVVVFVAGVGAAVCPVSSLLSVEQGYLSYPWEVFGNSSVVPDPYFACTSTMHSEHPDIPLHCSASTPCPHSLSASITSAITWNVRPSICASFQQTEEVINVVYFGGSVPHGHHARGCCCTEQSKCPLISNLCAEGDDGGIRAASCSWVGYLNFWMPRAYPELQFAIHDLTAPGTTSVEQAMKFAENYRLHDIHLKSTDIILIDYSVNDGTIYQHRLKDLQYGLESFIRRLLILGNFPTIIVLESLPSIIYNHIAFHPPVESDYSQVYRAVAKHYALPVWSYHDLVWSDAISATSFADFVRWSNNNRNSKEHPPWFVHLFMADAFATAWQSTVEACEKPIRLSANLALPAPLTEALEKQSLACEENSYYSLALSAPDEYLLSPDAQYFNLQGSTAGWQLVSERGGKVGYIADVNAPEATMVLPFNLTELVIKGSTLKIEYLKTHFNAGGAEVSVCGHVLGEVDALWKEETLKYSNNEIVVYRVCRMAQYCAQDTHPAIVIKHKLLSNRLVQRNLQKFKIVSVSMCSHEKVCMFAAGYDGVFTY